MKLEKMKKMPSPATKHKKVIGDKSQEQLINPQEQMKKMMEMFSVINAGIEENKNLKRKPLDTIEIGKLYTFPYEKGATSKRDKLQDLYLTPIKKLEDYYEYLSESPFSEYDDEDVPGENVLKKGTTCLVCDVVMKKAIYSKLYKKILNDENDKSNIAIVMIDNKFYMLGCKSFKEFAEELVETQTK